MAQAPTHPLLSLPDDEIVEKIREMNFEEVIEFSLISEMCKTLVKSAELQGIKVTANITSEVEVHFEIEGREWELKYFEFAPTSHPSEVRISDYSEPILEEKTIRRDQFGMEDWIKHLNTIFNFQGTELIRFDALSDQYDPMFIKKYFGVPSHLIIHDTGNFNHTLAILQTFLPVESLTIELNVLRHSIKPKILIQNFESLRIRESLPNQHSVVTLDDLLMTNSKAIVIERARMEPKDINKFIKLWQHGSNPQMEYLYIVCDLDKEQDQKAVLRRIKCTEIPNSERRSFRFSTGSVTPVIPGGKDIWRTDGVKATIQLGYFGCQIYVWFDHCIE